MSNTSKEKLQKRKFKLAQSVLAEKAERKYWKWLSRDQEAKNCLRDGVSELRNGEKLAGLSRKVTRRIVRTHGSTQEMRSRGHLDEISKWGTVAEIEEYSKPKTLYLDFDVARPVPSLIPILSRLRLIGIRAKWISYRRTRHGWHMVIGINVALIPSEQTMCQFALGSDPRRETMNARRAISMRVHGVSAHWKKRWNILFLRKL